MATKKYASITAITELWANIKAKFVEKSKLYGDIMVSVTTSVEQYFQLASLSVYDYDTGLNSELSASNNGVSVSSSFGSVDVSSSDHVNITGSEGVFITDADVSTSDGIIITSEVGGVQIYNVVTPTSNDMAANKAYVDGAIPTTVSSFTNDSGYLTLATLPIYNGSYSQVNS